MVGLVIGLVGIALALKSLPRRASMAFQFDGVVVIRGGDLKRFDERIGVTWNGREVTDLSISRIVVWNDGPKTVEGSQIVRSADRKSVV